MNKVTITTGQSLLDVAVWMLGGPAALFALADANGLAITDPVTPGQVLVVPDGYVVDQDVVNYYASRALVINTTNLDRPADPLVDEGEDWLETDFDTSNDFL